MEGYRQIERDFTSSRAPEYHKADSSLSIKGPRLVRIGQQRKIAGRKPTPIWIDFTVKLIKGEQHVCFGLALLLHVQQNRFSSLPKLPCPDARPDQVGRTGLERTNV